MSSHILPRSLRFALALLLVLAAACGDNFDHEPVGGAADVGLTDSNQTDGQLGEGIEGDALDGLDGQMGEVADDTDGGATCPGAAGCACDGDSECDDGPCLDLRDATGICAAACGTGCATGFTCGEVDDGGAQVDVCVPVDLTRCNPCTKNTDCAHPGDKDARCVSFGAEGSFCGGGCSVDDDCGTGSVCADATDVAGDSAKQCVPAADAMCTCSALASELDLSTACGVGGVCVGERSCGDAGLSACGAPAGGDESCNGLDDNCDGTTDEGSLCDDADVCTDDTCDSSGACKHTANTAACDDGDACTSADACKDGACAAIAISCDDNNPCTDDACDLATGCTVTANDANTCDDGSACTDDTCAAGLCVAAAIICDDANPCTDDACDVATGCTATDDDSNACDDGDACTDDACAASLCEASTVTCDDGNACTDDACDMATGCTATDNDNNACTDGNLCTDDACLAGKCSGSAIDCDDENSCTADSCDGPSGLCKHDWISGCGATVKLPWRTSFPCDSPGLAAWQLTGTPGGPAWAVDATPNPPAYQSPKCSLNFNDGVSFECPAGADAVGGSATTPTLDASAVQAGTAITAMFGLSGEWEETDTYDELIVEASTDGAIWDEVANLKHGDATVWAQISVDLSVYAGSMFQLRFRFVTEDCVANDMAGVFIDDLRVAVSDCAADSDCDDKNGCTTDTCDQGACAHAVKSCDDGQDCTLDVCDPLSGGCATFAGPDSADCDDGDACTSSDHCESGKCVAVALCDDANPCTVDACDADKGSCTNVDSADGAPCSDGDVCTAGDACAAGACVASPGACSQVVAEPFACDGAAGWVVDAAAAGSMVAWAIDATPAEPGFLSPKCSLNFNDGKAFECFKGQGKVGGAAISPVIDLSDAATATLSFWSWAQVDDTAAADHRYVEISTDAFATVALSIRLDNDSAGQEAWQRVDIDLGAVAGAKIQVRLRFDSGDCGDNGGAGWFIDDLLVTSAKAKACVGDAACDDDNACTDNVCADGVCLASANTATCDDGNACSSESACSDGGCLPTESTDCDDGESCTLDTGCDAIAGCLHDDKKDGLYCSDGDACTVRDRCVAGACVALPKCNDGNPCTLDSCDAGTCGHLPTAEGQTCSDGDPCTTDDICASGTCAGKLGACHDVVFDRFGCDEADQWQVNPPQVATETSWAVDATPGVPGFLSPACSLNINDGSSFVCEDGADYVQGDAKSTFTVDLTDVTAAQVSFWSWADIEKVDNADLRWVAVSTDDFKTVAASWLLDNGADTMMQWHQYQVSLDAFAGEKVRFGFYFDSVDCFGNDGAGWFIDDLRVTVSGGASCNDAAGCDDDNVCTADLCKTGGCVHFDVNGQPCEDGNKCTLADTCMGGTCAPGGVCDDGNACTTDACDPADGACTHASVADGLDCEDGDKCTIDDVCNGGACGGAPKCNSENPCALDVCDAETGGCGGQQVADGTPCKGGNPCIFGQFCIGGSCDLGVERCTFETLLIEPFDCGKAGDWVLDPLPADGKSTWAIDDSPKPPAYQSPSCSLNFNNGVDYDDGDAVAGTATSPLIVLPPGKVCVATFGSFNGVENDNEYDQRFIEISTDGFDKDIFSFQLDNEEDIETWADVGGVLEQWIGKTIQVRFRFDSVDDFTNETVGWFVDDLKITAGTPDPSCAIAADCNDSQACTIDTCKSGVCAWALILDGGACTDGDPCTVADACKAGACEATPKACGDGLPCTVDACNSQTGACTHDAVVDDEPCDDGQACTEDDKCTSGTCVGAPTVECAEMLSVPFSEDFGCDDMTWGGVDVQ